MVIAYLEYLIAVKKYGSMNKAAANLFCSQPTITKAVKSLEEELGCKIIERTTHGMTFTPMGERIVDEARIIINIVNGWKEASERCDSELQIAFNDLPSRREIFDLIYAYLRKNPDVVYTLEHSKCRGATILNNGSRQFRIGFFLHTPMEIPETKQLCNRLEYNIAQIKRCSFMLCASSRNTLAEKEFITVDDLRGRKVVLKQGTLNFPYIHKLLALDCDCTMAVGDNENVMIALVNNPALISFRPMINKSTDYYIKSGLVIAREIPELEMDINEYILYPKRMTPVEEDFVAFFKSHCRTFMPV